MPKGGRPENLKRGAAKKGDASRTAAATQARADDRAREEDLHDIAEQDPEKALLELHADLTVGMRRITKAWLRSGNKEPSRQMIEGSRELRQLSDVVRDILKARGTATEADEFFAGLSSRLAAPDLAEEPRPVVSVSGS